MTGAVRTGGGCLGAGGRGLGQEKKPDGIVDRKVMVTTLRARGSGNRVEGRSR